MLIIPKGKTVKFFGNGIDEYIEAIEFLLEEDINIKATSQFSSLVDGDSNKFVTLGASIIQDITNGTIKPPVGNKYLGFQQWSSTEPLSFSFNIGLYMKTSGYIDVVKPAQSLMRLVLPTVDTSGSLGKLGNFLAPGPSAWDVVFRANKRKRKLSVFIGSAFLDDAILTGADTTFSQDTDDLGHPIKANIRISMISTFTANNKMIDQLYSSNNIGRV